MAIEPGRLAADADAFYVGYVESFNRGDLDHYCACFGLPLAVVSKAGVRLVTAPADILAMAHQLQARFAELNWGRTEIVRRRAWPVEAGLALVVADLARTARDGTVFQRARYLYTLRGDAAGWKIATIAEALEPLPGSDGLFGPA